MVDKPIGVDAKEGVNLIHFITRKVDMKFSLPVRSFATLTKRALQFKGRIADVHPGFSLALVEITSKGALRISVGGPSSGARVIDKSVKDVDPGSVSLDLVYLDRIIANLPTTGQLDFSSEGSESLFEIGRMQMRMPNLPAEDFMALPRPPKESWFTIDRKALMDVINRCLWPLSKDTTRPMLQCVHMNMDKTESCNGHILSNSVPGIVPKGVDVAIPGDVFTNLRHLVADAEEKTLKMNVSQKVWFQGNGWAVYVNTLNGAYPDTTGMVFNVDENGEHDIRGTKVQVHWVYVNRSDAVNIVRRISGTSVSVEQREVGAAARFITDDEGSIHLVSHYPIEDMSKSIVVDDILPWSEGSVKASDPSPFHELSEVGLYSYYMLMALESLESDVVRVLWSGSDMKMPVQFHDEENGIAALVMPRRIR